MQGLAGAVLAGLCSANGLSLGSASRSTKSVAGAPPFFQFFGRAAALAAARPKSLGSGGVQKQHRGGSNFCLLRPPSQGILGRLCSFSPRPAVRPNTSFKRTPNSVAPWPASAGPAAHFALAGQGATLLGSA